VKRPVDLADALRKSATEKLDNAQPKTAKRKEAAAR
jgi:hypothetical protein